MQLEGKVVVVTGSSGIAAAAATGFAAEGARVFVIGIDEDSCQELCDVISSDGGDCEFAHADLTVEDQAERAFRDCSVRFGRIDGLFAVAGASGRRYGDGPIHEIPLEGWEATLRINGHPAFLAAREAVRAMIDSGRGGSVVMVSSVLAAHPSPDLFATHAYAAVKGAENALVRTLASYYARHAIRVNGVAPGLVATPMSHRAASDPGIMDFVRRKQPLAGGLLEPADVAGVAQFLISDAARAVTGQVIDVDGGWGVTEAMP